MQGSQGLTETEAKMTEPVWVCTRSSVYVLYLLAGCFCGTPDSGSGGPSDSLPALGTPFFLLGCFTHSQYESLFQSYCILLCHVELIFLGSLLFSERKWRGGSGKMVCVGTGRRKWRGSRRQDVLKTKQRDNL